LTNENKISINTRDVYSYEDAPEKSGTYYYELEDVDIYGNSSGHGPIKVRVKIPE